MTSFIIIIKSIHEEVLLIVYYVLLKFEIYPYDYAIAIINKNIKPGNTKAI